MIKFFRKIRQKMLIENKLSKYVIYAIGEILLVVIGILIALQINNFNNHKQQRQIEQVYLSSLKAEFQTNMKKIDDCLARTTERMHASEDMLALFDKNIIDTTSSTTLSNILYGALSGSATYTPSKGVLTDIISSGNLNLIQNEQLRQNLASFESTLVYTKLQEASFQSTNRKLRSQFNERGSVRRVLRDRGVNFKHQSISDTLNNKKMFNSIEFENTLLDYYLTIKAANGPMIFGGIKEQIELILVAIDSELK
ncbi:MAG: hypothetical protein ACI9EV_002227 [Urechidicola sp.]|jgi:hypothetical protein